MSVTDSIVSPQHYALLEAGLQTPEKLEVLSAVRGSAVGGISRGRLASTLRLDEDVVDTILDELEVDEFIERDPTREVARLGAAARESICESLLQLYQMERVAVLAAQTSIALGRIRSMAASTFGGAFALRKKGDGNEA